ncbi:Putative membrane protein insertion efficiency factor [Natranaerofaba carboxydovora]|nr:membrane protein insertion efficiency factor YidD [Natranaerofaba carboxydovora]UMZ75185.1 Putative membrane protein insertion efficiency factor [Natranaerofaba carboxydovora]
MIKFFFILLIRFYKSCVSPLFPNTCRFYPSCSSYAMEAVIKYGVLKGCFLSLKRILKCNPFFSGGYDPVE